MMESQVRFRRFYQPVIHFILLPCLIQFFVNAVAYFELGSYDIRSLLVTGLAEKGSRYLEKYLEEITSLVRKLRAEGKNVTQYDFVVNMEGQNLVQHACLQCKVLNSVH